MKKAMKYIYGNSLLFCVIISFFLTLATESLSHRSFFATALMMLTKPYIFLLNMAVIFLTLSWGLFIKRRDFAFITMSLIWIGMGIGNFILQFFRVTPLCGGDFLILRAAIGIMDLYLSVPQIIMTVIALAAVAVCSVVFFIKGAKQSPDRKKGGIVTAVLAVLISSVVFTGVLKDDFSDMITAYKSYGFAYSFLKTVFDRGIDEPYEYSEKRFKDVIRTIENMPDNEPEIKPNIIFVQLESFFDVNLLNNISFSENPVPNFTRLKNEFSSGFLEVPVIGGGTANTEFEVLTGIDLNFFGAGECPFETELDRTTCESVAYNLKEHGYKSHAIHNHTGTFYERNRVYPNLGFDTFTSVEYMNNIERNSMNWAKDTVLIPYINEALNSTENTDFVYTVTVQGHGNYPKTPVKDSSRISVEGTENEEEKNKYTYYVNQLYETDMFIGELVAEMEKRSEPCIIVFYGDHLPAFRIEDKDIKNGNIYETEYVIWDNTGMKKENKDMKAYFLSSYVLSKIGVNTGLVNRLNTYYANNPEYKKFAEILAYNIFNAKDSEHFESYEPADTQPGIIKPEITDAVIFENSLKIKGSGFTDSSVIMINNDEKRTFFIDDGTLVTYDVSSLKKSGNVIKVCQISQSGDTLSQTAAFFNITKN